MEKALLIIPYWKSQPWFPLIVSNLISYPIRLPRHRDLLTLPHARRSGTPIVQKSEDGRCSVIRKRLQSQGVPESATNIIINSWRRGTQKQYGLIWEKRYFWCLRGAINPFHTSETCNYIFGLLG